MSRATEGAPERAMSDETLEEIGAMVDKADNLIAASQLPLPAPTHVSELRRGLGEIRAKLRAIYTSHGGEDWWAE